jgi:predicted SprT family Zn-dependent metalloprotease
MEPRNGSGLQGRTGPVDGSGYRCARCGKRLSFATDTSDIQTPEKANRYPRLHRGKMYCYPCWCGFSRNRRNAARLAGEPVDW